MLQYTRHIFGAKDSPTCANYALQRTALDNEKAYPVAAKAVLEKFYMDDYLDSFACPDKALSASQELVEMLKLGGFKLTKFISNVPNLAQTVDPSTDISPAVKEIVSNTSVASHVLGLKWDHVADTLNVSRGTQLKENRTITQRTVLSVVSAVFDPLGLVAPFTVQARVLLKEIWRLHGQQWDDPLPESIRKMFLDWCSGLPELQELTIPRAFFPLPIEEIELHMFGDSSQEVFSAVGFLRAKCEGNNDTYLSFVVGKARVAPMKAMSMPKLELQASLLATRLRQKIIDALTIEVPTIFMWTDSTTVLQWLASSEKQPVFVANRVAEILESTTIDQWYHVTSANNPADHGTRGLAASSLTESSWVRGPEFLRTHDWPFKPSREACVIPVNLATLPTDDVPVHSLAANATPVGSVINWDRFSSYNKFVRVVAYVLRLLPKHRHFRTANKCIVDAAEFDIAESRLKYLTQIESFPHEVKNLTSNVPLRGDKSSRNSKNRLNNFSPFIGSSNLIRSKSRLNRLDNVGYDTKHPIILDGKHPCIRLMLQYLHQKHHHQGSDYVRAQVSSAHIILGIRSALRSIRARCITCRKRAVEVINPIMADLPRERLGFQQPPFSNCGIDYFGPFYVTVRRSTEKRWAFLFTCLTTRAVHLEVVNSMDTSACVSGIERFAARRGTPKVVWSDNGTNFIGAQKELLEAVLRWNERAPAAFAHAGITWKFNPPSAPHHGGSWEIMVRSCKRVFYCILGTRKLTDEVLSTTLCLVEQALNARPLTPVTDDPEDLEALTPNHFLLGCASASLPSSVHENEPNLRKRYTKAQALANAVWSRWMKDYVPSLHKRSKWSSDSGDTLKTGDLVWIVDSNNPRGCYPLARIVDLRYGSDAVARSAEIHTSTGTLVRPIVKLAPVFDPSSSLGPEDVSALGALAIKVKSDLA